MVTKKVKSRLLYLFILLVSASIVIILIFNYLEKNVVYFFTPTEIFNESDISLKKKIRVGGLVKKNSVKKDDLLTKFIITDQKNEIIVTYEGILPNLFSEEKGVVAEGVLKDKKYFVAYKILAKHDENYMPPEVSESIKKTNNQ